MIDGQQITNQPFNHPAIYILSQSKIKSLPQLQNITLKTQWLLACFIFPILIFSQAPSGPSAFITIDKIYIEGNKLTKTDIILRELDFVVGDTILLSSLTYRLKENEYNVMNTGLFTSATISFKDWEGVSNKVGLNIEVKEDWYIFPFPIVELADRNFNVWWEDYNHSLKRLNLGVRFYHTNATGRKDLLKAVVQFGFTKKYEFVYSLPAFNKAKTWGANVNVLYTREKEIGFTTVDNKLLFHRNDDDVLLQRLRLGGGLFYRKKLDVTHHLDVTYRSHRIHESIAKELNPDFFLNSILQEYVSLKYQFTIDKRDIRPYPMNGYFLNGSLAKHGLSKRADRQSLEAAAIMKQYFSFGKNWSVALAARGKAELQREKQPYYTSRALGYEEDFIRGYEFYVIDGSDYIYLKKALRFNFFTKEYDWGRYMKFDSFKKMPIKLFLVLHNELGYVNNPFYKNNNPLSNEILWGVSLGLDVVIYYNKVFNIEYSRNHLGERGFFLHWTLSF